MAHGKKVFAFVFRFRVKISSQIVVFRPRIPCLVSMLCYWSQFFFYVVEMLFFCALKSSKTIKIMTKRTRIFDIMLQYEAHHPEQKKALSCKRDGQWIFYSPAEYREIANLLSFALLKKGICKGDKVGIISTNRPEWTITQMAVTQIGAVLVPIYPTISAEDYHYILKHSEVKLLIMEGAEVMEKIKQIRADITNLKDLYTFVDRKDFPYWDQLIEFGRQNQNPTLLQERRDNVNEKECAMIIYTSGTTGDPKGVMLSHYNLMKQLENLKHIPAEWSKKALSFLPLCHAYENMLVLLYQYLGMTVYFVSYLTAIQSAIKEVHPTMMSAVPRVFEKFYDGIMKGGRSQKGLAKKLFFWGVNVAKAYKIEPEDRSAWYNLKHKIADRLIYSKIRQNLGIEDFDIFVSGAASLQPDLCAFFSAIGMPVFEGYGMTEASPVIAVSCREKYGREARTVGFPLGGVEIAITPEGEVICRGHNVMMGYFKNDEGTREIIDADGWLHTGDLGHFTAKGQLVLTGRKKNLFKTSMGKYVNPQVIEDRLVRSPFIENAVVVGENQRFAAALIIPDFTFLKVWCENNKVSFTSNKEIVNNQKVIMRIKKEVDECNRMLGKAENIMKFQLIADEWSQATGYLTPTLKVKRNKVLSNYKQMIDQIYEGN